MAIIYSRANTRIFTDYKRIGYVVWTSVSFMVQNFESVSWPYITKVLSDSPREYF